jgi:hypothetical protein
LLVALIRKRAMQNKEPVGEICTTCNNFARTSLAQEIATGLQQRGFWAPRRNADGRWDNGDLISAVFQALEKLRLEAVEAKTKQECSTYVKGSDMYDDDYW